MSAKRLPELQPEPILILGGGGHARVVIDLLQATSHYTIAGIVDPGLPKGSEVLGVPILGGDELLPELLGQGIKNICIAIGSVKSNLRRKELYENAKRIGYRFPSLIHPSAYIGGRVLLSPGIQIMARAVVQTSVAIGENSILNTGSIVEHDCIIGSHVHICPGAVISGECSIEDGSFFGAGATMIQGIRVGKNSFVAAGSVVINDIPAGTLVNGVPAK